ncbi:MAG: M24 family metallopeptidase [Candidatus Bilamarchaeaceae archaeon]
MDILICNGECPNPNFFYLTGLRVDNSYLLIRNGRKTLYTYRLNERRAREEFGAKGAVKAVSTFDEVMKALPKRFCSDLNHMTARMYMKLKRGRGICDITEQMLEKRARKGPGEMAKIREAVHVTREILGSIDISDFRTESDLYRQLAMETAERGLEFAFEPIVAADRNSGKPHHRAGPKKIEKMVLVDFGVKCDGYCADLTRCYFKEKCNAKADYDAMGEVFGSVLDGLGDCSTGKDVARLAEREYRRRSIPLPPHSIGHGIGLEVHEYPRLKSTGAGDQIMKAAMAIEPAVYRKEYGVRYEDDVYFDGKRARLI